MRSFIKDNVRKIVLKFGTKIILKNILNFNKENNFFSDFASLIDRGYQFSIVSSGAVGLGMESLGIKTKPQPLQKKQALAAVGQSILIQRWNHFLHSYGIKSAQVLLTNDIFEDRKRFLHTRDCLSTLFNLNIIPIINENDTVAIDELKFGDNDILSVLTAIITEADLLIIFSDIDGLYKDINDKSSLITTVQNFKDIEQYISDKNDNLSTGGMTSKINAAKLAVQNGIGVIITNGNKIELNNILSGKEIGTLFVPQKNTKNFRKKWIFFKREIKGKLFIDEGAKIALLKNKKSLLPRGVYKIEGIFNEGDIVSIYDNGNYLIGKGIVYYSSDEIQKIMGKNSRQIQNILGYKVSDEIINRDNLILLTEEGSDE